MNSIDIIIGIILLIAFVIGLKKGFFVALASLVGLIAGVYGAIYFSGFAAGYLSRWFDWSERTTTLVAFAVTFLIIVFVITLAGKVLTKIVSFAALGIVNRLLGGVFYLLVFAFIISVVFMFFDVSESTKNLISEEKKNDSILYYPVASFAPIVIPQIIREVENYQESERDENRKPRYKNDTKVPSRIAP